MNPFAKPEESVPYEYVEFPKVEVKRFSFENFSQDLSQEVSSPSHPFVDFLDLKDQPEERITSVQLAILQNFKDVLLPAEG
jgi:hypothetical protein